MAYQSSKLQIGMNFDKRFLSENPHFHLGRFAYSRLAASPNPLGERPCFVCLLPGGRSLKAALIRLFF
jgi:hypothetical protein